jgi:hypothetical protein
MNKKSPQQIHRQERQKPFQSKEWKEVYPDFTPEEPLLRELRYRLKAAPRQRRISVALFLLVLLPVFYFYCIRPIIDYSAARRLLTEGLRAEAVIDKISPQKRSLQISYHYTVDQEEYQGRAELFFHEGNLLVGHSIPLFYDPARPEVHRLAEDLHVGRMKARLVLTWLFSAVFIILLCTFALLRWWADSLSVRIIHTMARQNQPVSPRAVLEEVDKIPKSIPGVSALGGTGPLFARMAFPARQRIYLGSWLWSFSPLAFPPDIFDSWFMKQEDSLSEPEKFLIKLDLLNHARLGYSLPVAPIEYSIPKQAQWTGFDERASLISSYRGLPMLFMLFQKNLSVPVEEECVAQRPGDEGMMADLIEAGPSDRVILDLADNAAFRLMEKMNSENLEDTSPEDPGQGTIPLVIEHAEAGQRRLLFTEEEAAEFICDALFFFYLCPWRWESAEKTIQVAQPGGDSLHLRLEFEPSRTLSIERISD